MLYFYFFKQKTAYELRISDWSSDVCSSDLFEKAVGLLACRRLIQGLAAKKHIVLPPPSRVKAEISITERSTVFSANGILPLGHRKRLVGTVVTIRLHEAGIFGMRPSSEESRVGKGGVSPGRSGWWPY